MIYITYSDKYKDVFKALNNFILGHLVKCYYDLKIEQLLQENIQHESLIIQILNNIFKQKNTLGTSSKKTFDHIKDFKYIYSAFMQVYNIDLIDTNISMIKYLYLLDGIFKLQDNALTKVIEIRQMDLPQQTSDNAKQIQSILDLKLLYRLEDESESQNNSVKNLFNFSKKIAKGVI